MKNNSLTVPYDEGKAEGRAEGLDEGEKQGRENLKLCIQYIRQGLSDVDIATKLGKGLSEAKDTILVAREILHARTLA